MKVAIFALIFACYQYTEAANWAVLVAGSTGYGNYRHQADIAHSYQLVKSHGIPASNIITMMYDDVAYNSRNPYKGNLINVPGGPNVYAGIHVDYRGRDCNARNFLSVLEGNSEAVNGNKVLGSTSSDNVFVYYADHGNKQLIAMPGGVLYSRSLIQTINNMFSANRYKNLVFYVEACFSGSMFYRRLPRGKRVYAITAANERESSYSCYYDRSRRTYLADEFSAKWMHDSETNNFGSHSLNAQYQNIRRGVRMSHVMQYGDTTNIGNMVIGKFQGGNYYESSVADLPPITDAVPTWEVPYMSLLHQLQDANTTQSRMEILYELQAEQSAQLKIKSSMKSIVEKIVPHAASMMQVRETATTEEQDHCYEQAVAKYTESCKQFQEYDYAMKDLHVFANLCNSGESIENINEAIEEVCLA